MGSTAAMSVVVILKDCLEIFLAAQPEYNHTYDDSETLGSSSKAQDHHHHHHHSGNVKTLQHG